MARSYGDLINDCTTLTVIVPFLSYLASVSSFCCHVILVITL